MPTSSHTQMTKQDENIFTVCGTRDGETTDKPRHFLAEKRGVSLSFYGLRVMSPNLPAC